MRSTKAFFENGYYRVELGIKEVRLNDQQPRFLVMEYTKKPVVSAIRIVGTSLEKYNSLEDLTIPKSGDPEVMLRNFKRVLKGRKVVPEDAFTRFGCLCEFLKNIKAWYPNKNSLLS